MNTYTIALGRQLERYKEFCQMNRKYFCPLICMVIVLMMNKTATVNADVSLPAIISDHMVLQAGMKIPIWGWAEPNEAITVSIAGQTRTTTADEQNKWMVTFDTLRPGTAATLTVKGKNTIVVNDVLIGEVWLCSGQSNMVWPVSKADDSEKEKASAEFPQIRMFFQNNGPMITPFPKGHGRWVVCGSNTVASFSAVAYFFGRNLHQKLNQPVGLIYSAVDGSLIEAWTSLDVQKDVPALNQPPENGGVVDAERMKHYPGNLFNGKIFPLIPYAIRGAIWYQGESATVSYEKARLYEKQLPSLIRDWRSHWGQGDFPFAWVQLPKFQGGMQFPAWCEVRESMLKTLSLPETGMVIALDLGHPKQIHPTNKQEVGRRFALWARAQVYGENIPFSGPLPAGVEIKGDEIICTFEHANGGLKAREGDLKGFTISGADRKWIKADASIEGNKVIVSSPEVKAPTAVRYAWQDDPDCNLMNGAGLPASPFRTDDDN